MTKNSVRQLVYLLLPAVLFYVCYSVAGILIATLVSAALSLGVIVRALTTGKKIANTQLLGLLGLALSFVAILFTGNEKLYYVPALIQNVCFAAFIGVLTVKRRSVLHYVTRDFDLPAMKRVPEAECLRVNAVWLAFFLLKIVAKVLGIFFLDFTVLYWLVFALGDPMTLLVAGYSIYAVNRKITRAREGAAPE